MIINLTQHAATAAQIAAGVTDLSTTDKEMVSEMLTFNDLPAAGSIEAKANALADYAALVMVGVDIPHYAMIGGAPYLMSALENALIARDINPLYAFSRRVSVESTDDAGVVTKTNVFEHAGWVSI